MARTKREKKIEDLLDQTESKALNAVSQLKVATEWLKQTIPFMHNSILNGDGDLTETHRSDFSKVLDPSFLEIMTIITELSELNSIFDEDPILYQNKLKENLTKYPQALAGAESKLG